MTAGTRTGVDQVKDLGVARRLYATLLVVKPCADQMPRGNEAR